MSAAGKILTILGALTFIAAVSLGARIFRWEAIIWPAVAILWVISSWTWEALWKDSQR